MRDKINADTKKKFLTAQTKTAVGKSKLFFANPGKGIDFFSKNRLFPMKLPPDTKTAVLTNKLKYYWRKENKNSLIINDNNENKFSFGKTKFLPQKVSLNTQSASLKTLP